MVAPNIVTATSSTATERRFVIAPQPALGDAWSGPWR